MTHSTPKLVRLSLLVSVGLILYVLEAHIPQPLPWARIGLANVVTLMALILWGFWEALVVVLLRTFLGSLVVGTLLSPVFLFALGGGLASLICMGLAHRYLQPLLSVVGISVLGALAHNLTQLTLAYSLYVHRGQIFFLLPFLLLASVLTGFFVGAVVFLTTARKALEGQPAEGLP
jgi:heptaprenyl diphosphate synthase